MKNKGKKILSTITNIIFSIVFVALTISTIYFIDVINRSPSLNVEYITKRKSSKIYDVNNNLIKQLTMEDYENITYDMLPDVFINALLSSEDIRFFMHEGIDLPRLLSALKNDVLTLSLKEGASTLTQQLVKNMMLTNTKSIERKIQEIYLSNQMEKLYSKKEILEFYCNYVCFDGVSHGVQNASYKFFNKSVSMLTLPEAALLVGVVNAPSAYSPLKNPQKANERKNTVLHLMEKHGYISSYQKEQASLINVEDLIVKKEESKDNNTYPYQAYIDVVYKQILDKTGYDPYVVPMEIHTFMDSALQKEIDELQSSSSYFPNEYQQFASTIIDNENGSIKAIFGGRNYQGQKLLNKAYDVLYQPASTIKVVLDYALAFEHLNWSNQQVVLDLPTTYPNTSIQIKNVDNTFMGELTIAEAIGYSRNTSAINTLKEVIDKIGMESVINYLKDINLMDTGTFSYSYGLGGYTYGVSVTNLAAAYSMLARNGLYIEPLAVKSIKLLDGSERTISFAPYSKKVLSEDTCYLIIDVLNQVMDANMWSIQDCKANNVNVYAKTGTTSFDKSLKEKLNYPASASKDRWLASFSKDYSVVCWSGFDEYLKNEKTYFLSGSSASNLVKKFSKLIYSKIAKTNQTFEKPETLKKVKIVKGSNYLATDFVDKKYIINALYKEGYLPTQYFEEPLIEESVSFDYFILDNTINFIISNQNTIKEYNVIYDIDKIMGGKDVYLDVYKSGIYEQTIMLDKISSYNLETNNYYQFDIYYKYKNGLLNGKKERIEFYL